MVLFHRLLGYFIPTEIGLVFAQVIPSGTIRDVEAIGIDAVPVKGTARTRRGRAQVKPIIAIVRTGHALGEGHILRTLDRFDPFLCRRLGRIACDGGRFDVFEHVVRAPLDKLDETS